MSNQDRIIFAIATVLMIAAFTGGYQLLKSVNQQRVDLELTVNPDIYNNLPPAIALTQTALGSFRGLAIDVMWQRLWNLQQEGKYQEAEQLSKAITLLQPRFPDVWANRAWNMAYNISVQTHTPEERWMWVRKGIDLLRGTENEAGGIELNPTSILVYKELSWIFLHKVGMLSDDMHKYYKLQLAREWEEVLGSPPADSTQAMLDWFEPIAKAHEIANGLKPGEFVVVTPRYDNGQLERYLAARPEVRQRVKDIEAMGYKLDRDLLSDIAVLVALKTSTQEGYLRQGTKITRERKQELLLEWIDQYADTPSGKQLLDFVRAKVLATNYRMDPAGMYELMAGQWMVMDPKDPMVKQFMIEDPDKPVPLPIDWRHPAAHGAYWAWMGVRISQRYRLENDQQYFTMLNTDRQVIHSIQAMTHNGKVIFDLASMQYDLMPDIRFLPAYGRTMLTSSKRIAGKYVESTAPETFQVGYENYMIWATRMYYNFGAITQANDLYKRLGLLYGKSQEGRLEKYSQPLKDFVVAEIKDNMESPDEARVIITGNIYQALVYGFGYNNAALAAQKISMARQLHEWFQKQKAGQKAFALEEGRMTLKPFDEMVSVVLQELMTSRTSLWVKVRIWKNPTDNPYLEERKRQVYDGLKDYFARLAQLQDGQIDKLFHEPQGMDEFRRQKKIKAISLPNPQNPDTPPRVENK